MRLLWLHLLPLRPFARIHRDWIKQPIRAGGESDACPAHAAGSSLPLLLPKVWHYQLLSFADVQE